MKKYTFAFVIIVLVLAFGVLVWTKLATYTDITSDPAFMDDFYVAEIPSTLAIEDCQSLKTELLYAPIILKVTPLHKPEFFFKGWQQKVRIEYIFSASTLCEGDEIYITSSRWKAYIKDKAIDTSFVNFMSEGQSYLIFVEKSVGFEHDKTEVFKLYTKRYIAPVFSYDIHANSVYPVSGDSTYVPYAEVNNNEFFADSVEGLDAFLSLKSLLIETFPAES